MNLNAPWQATRSGFRKLMPLNEPDAVLHLVLIAVPACFGFILLLPADTFTTAGIYLPMQAIMDEGAWAALSLIVATAALVSWISGKPYLILATQMLISFWHSLIAICFMTGNPYGVNSLTYAILAVAAIMRLVGMSYDHSRR